MASINCISWEEVVLGRLTEITEIWSQRELRLLNCKLTHLRKRYIIFCKSFTDSIHIIRWSATSVIQTFLIEEILKKNCGNSVCSRLSENENFLPRLIDNKFEKEGGEVRIQKSKSVRIVTGPLHIPSKPRKQSRGAKYQPVSALSYEGKLWV